MRTNFISYLIVILCIASACNGKRSATSVQDSVSSTNFIDTTGIHEEVPVNTQKGTFDKSYSEKQLKPAVHYLSDMAGIVYFEDSLQGDFCSLYLKSLITLVDSTRKPDNYSSIVSTIEEGKAVLVINGVNVELKNKITDANMMLPTYLGAFKKSERNFLLIKMSLVSYMAGDYWYSLLLELDGAGHVVNQKGFETTGEIGFDQLTGGLE